MARPDIPCKNHEYDGWQAIDATPQEKSDGMLQTVAAVSTFLCFACYGMAGLLLEKKTDIVKCHRQHHMTGTVTEWLTWCADL